MADARTGFVSMDCADPLALGEFWAAMLGGEIAFTNGTTVGIRTDWVWLSAMKVDGYVTPTWPDDDVPKQILRLGRRRRGKRAARLADADGARDLAG